MGRLHLRVVMPVLVAVLVTALAAPLAAPAHAQDDPVSEGAATDTCRSLPALPQQVCDAVRSVTHGVAAFCRRTGEPEACTPANGQEVSTEQVAAYTASPIAAAHDLQRRLQVDLPFRHATFVATHNSYNAYAYRPTLSGMDANQTYSMTDQLDMDVRRLELDVHTWTDVETGATTPILCHATNAGPVRHVGCTAEQTLRAGLEEIDAWLDAHPDQVVMLRVETHLDGAAGYDAAAAIVQDVIGDHILTPGTPAGGCTPFDLDMTRADILDADAHVLMVSDCGQGEAWRGLVWDDGGVRVESTVRSQDFTYPHCAGIPRTSPPEEVSFATRWIRFYDDATLLSSMASFGGNAPQRVTPAIAREWTRCGVNQPAFDHLTPTDGRLAALVWTWAAGEGATDPAAACARLRATDGRLESLPCAEATVSAAQPALCRDATGALAFAESVDDGSCTLEVPRSGHEAQVASELATAAGVDHLVVALHLVEGTWQPTA